MRMQLSEINEIVRGVRRGEDVAVSSVSINTRTMRPGDCFIAIKGDNFDGNDYVEQAERSESVAAILHRKVETTLPYIIVADTRKALAEFACAWRQKTGVKAIGITGSNGKTTVKEMIAAILAVNGNVLSTQGNLNNDIGVPLTLLRLDSTHQFAVVEMGANHPGEIAYLSRYVKPDVAVITNVGPAHIEGFGSVDGVAKAKGEMIDSLGESGVAILNADDPYFESWKARAGSRKIISFGLGRYADVSATQINSGIRCNQFVTEFNLVWEGQELPIQMSLAGNHNVINALSAGAACLAAGVDLLQIQKGLATVKPVSGRLQPLMGDKGCIVINDSYNANPASLKAALDVLMAVQGEPWVVLGAFGELGEDSREIHEEMGRLIRSKGVVRLLATGSDAEGTVRAFGKGAGFFSTQSDLIDTLKNELNGSEAVLIKGSRAQKMEKVAAALTVQVNR